MFSLAENRNGWQVISPSKSFTVYAATATEKAEWMAHINKCVNDLIKKSMCSQKCLDIVACNRVDSTLLPLKDGGQVASGFYSAPTQTTKNSYRPDHNIIILHKEEIV